MTASDPALPASYPMARFVPVIGELADTDFFSEGVLAHPYAFLRRMRAEAPVFPAYQASHARRQYLVATYDLIQQVLTNPQRFSSNYLPILSGGGTLDPEVEAVRAKGFEEVDSLLTADDGDHRRMRKLVSNAFTPRRIKAMNDTLRTVVEDLIDRFAAQGECDFIAEFASGLPSNALAHIMGIDRARYDDVDRWGAAIARRFGQMGTLEERIADEYTILEAKDFMDELIAERRANPGDDLISDLVTAEADDEAPLTEAEIRATIFILLVGGTETTFSTLNFCMAHLAQDEAMRTRLTQNEADISAFIDEVLRFYTPVAGTWRIAREDVSLGGVDIPSGSILMVRLDSANRDPGQFERPDTFDIDRKGNARHLGFGGGAHSCIGFRVAKLELQHSISALLKRLKSPRLIEEGTDLDIVPSTHARCIRKLRLAFEPEPANQ